jgi:hypothetical protein
MNPFTFQPPPGKRIKLAIYKGVELEPSYVRYCDDEPVSGKAAKPAKVKPRPFSRFRVEAFLDDWREWKRQTDGTTIDCRRHHLGQRLTHFKESDIRLVITLARIGEGGVAVPFSAARSETKKFLKGREFVNVIFEYYGCFEDLVLEGMRLVDDHEQACRNQASAQADVGMSEKAA